MKSRKVRRVESTVMNVVTSLASLGDENIVDSMSEKLSEAAA
jgi:hypothetical protein